KKCGLTWRALPRTSSISCNGPAGLPWGVTLTEREDVCLGVRAVLTEKMLEAALERQAADHPRRPSEFGACPGCHRPLDRDDVEARLVQTRAGQVEWLEPPGL